MEMPSLEQSPQPKRLAIEVPHVAEEVDPAEWEKATSADRAQLESAQVMLHKFAEQVSAAERSVAEAQEAKDAAFARLGESNADIDEVNQQMAVLDVALERAKAVHASKTALYENSRAAYKAKYGLEFEPHTLN